MESTTTNSNSLGTKIEESPLQSDINRHGEQIEKLTELVSILHSRLRPILNTQNETGCEADNKDIATSPFRGQINHQTEMIKSIGITINLLLEQMEV